MCLNRAKLAVIFFVLKIRDFCNLSNKLVLFISLLSYRAVSILKVELKISSTTGIPFLCLKGEIRPFSFNHTTVVRPYSRLGFLRESRQVVTGSFAPEIFLKHNASVAWSMKPDSVNQESAAWGSLGIWRAVWECDVVRRSQLRHLTNLTPQSTLCRSKKKG